MVVVSKPRFSGSSYPLNIRILLIFYDFMAIFKMATEMTAVTLQLACLLKSPVLQWLDLE